MTTVNVRYIVRDVEEAIALDVLHPVLPEALVQQAIGQIRVQRRQRDADGEGGDHQQRERMRCQ